MARGAFLRERLVPLAGLLTPNAPEAAVLLGREVVSATDLSGAKVFRTASGHVMLTRLSGAVEAVAQRMQDPEAQGHLFEGAAGDSANDHRIRQAPDLLETLRTRLATDEPLDDDVDLYEDYLEPG